MLINELVKFSNKYGSNPELVLAGGGNTSAKADGRMWVKGSGTSLSTITAEGFVEMDLSKLNEIFENEYPDSDDEREALVLKDLMAARALGSQDKRPSVETTLHGLFEYTYVLHLHPALVNGLTCSKGGEKTAREIIKRDFIWIEQCKPGYVLAKICFDRMSEYKAQKDVACDMLLLENHGIFVAGDTVEELDEKLMYVMNALSSAIKEAPEFTADAVADTVFETDALLKFYPENSLCVQVPFGVSKQFCKNREAAAELLKPFTPDHIVYCRAYPLWLDSVDEAEIKLAEYRESNGCNPRVVMIKGVGVFCVGDNEKQAKTAGMLFEDAAKIAVYSRSFSGASHMTEELTDFIVNWEVESYRSSRNA